MTISPRPKAIAYWVHTSYQAVRYRQAHVQSKTCPRLRYQNHRIGISTSWLQVSSCKYLCQCAHLSIPFQRPDHISCIVYDGGIVRITSEDVRWTLGCRSSSCTFRRRLKLCIIKCSAVFRFRIFASNTYKLPLLLSRAQEPWFSSSLSCNDDWPLSREAAKITKRPINGCMRAKCSCFSFTFDCF